MNTPHCEAVDHVLRQGEAFAENSFEDLRLSLDTHLSEHQFEAMAPLKMKMKTEPLFSQLGEIPCLLLVTLYWHRQALTRLVNVSHQDAPPSLRAQT